MINNLCLFKFIIFIIFKEQNTMDNVILLWHGVLPKKLSIPKKHHKKVVNIITFMYDFLKTYWFPKYSQKNLTLI